MKRALVILGLLLAGGVGFELIRGGVRIAEYSGTYAVLLPAVSGAPMLPYQINLGWVLEGTPVIHSAVFATSPDGRDLSGIWECVGPTKFRWHFESDESIYVLEGLVNIEFDGVIHTLLPGQTAYFPAGKEAIWDVPVRVKKSFTLHEPGRSTRWLRKLF